MSRQIVSSIAAIKNPDGSVSVSLTLGPSVVEAMIRSNKRMYEYEWASELYEDIANTLEKIK